MNTSKIGNQFEARSLDIIKKLIEEEQLGHIAEYLKILPKQKYFSHQRNGYIEFDLAIEVWPPGATRYFMIYLIECKNYETRVSVGKIEEFLDKIRQVGGVRVKGIFITNSPLQEAAYNTAESTGMMVIQGESCDDYKIILHKKSKEDSSGRLPFIKNTIESPVMDEGVQLMERLIDRKILSAFDLTSDKSTIGYGIDKLSKEDIETSANKELNKIDPKILLQGYTLNAKKLTEYLQQEYKIDFLEIKNNPTELGTCDLKNNTIGINNSLLDSKRELFVIAHEFGHYVLHQKFSIGQVLYDLFSDSNYNFKTNKHDLKNPRQWIEWQANYFASSLILPKAPFLVHVQKTQARLKMHEGKIYLDDQQQNIKDFAEITKMLAYIYNTSKTSVIYKLKEMDLLIDKSRLRHIGEIIAEYQAEFFV